jgi:AraC-like DNA-binding protein
VFSAIQFKKYPKLREKRQKPLMPTGAAPSFQLYLAMEFRMFPPVKNLQPFIQGYLEADFTRNSEIGEHTLFPNGFSGMFFNFGNKGKLVLSEEYETPDVSVFGQIDRHFTIMHQPGFYSLGVLMKPTALASLLQINMAEITNRAFDGRLVRNDLRELHEKVEAAPSTRAKIECLENYFTGKFKSITHYQSISDYALHLIHQQEATSIERLTTELKVSQRFLEKDFKNRVGLSPKTYSMIIRFKRIEAQLKKQSAIAWNRMDFAHEYYDQNHFIKDFKRFTGHTPSDYLLKPFSMGRSYLVK